MFDLDHLKKTYFKMAMPVVIGLVITLIYNLVDTWFISQTRDVNIIAGVSLCSPIFTTLMAFGNIYGQGGSSLISRLLGKKDSDSIKRVSSFCFYISIITGAVIAAIMLVFRDGLLKMLGADAATLLPASDYYTVMAIGAPIVVLTFIHSNLVRCEGMALQSMIGNILGTVLNIILDPILIFNCNMGAKGAAVATILGYLLTDVFFLILVMMKSKNLSVDIRSCRVNGEELWQILGVGVTAAITNIMSSLCVIIVNRMLLPFGENYIASMGMVLRVNMIAQLVLTGFAFGGVPVFGFIFGSNNRQKLNELIKFCIMFLGGLSIVLTLILFFGSSAVMSIFTPDPELLSICSSMLRFQVAGTIFVSVVLLTTVLFQATGKVIQAFIMSISRQGVIFIVVVWFLSGALGYTGIIASQVVADFVSAAIGLFLYFVTFASKKDSEEASIEE